VRARRATGEQLALKKISVHSVEQRQQVGRPGGL
jgi:hypothetical protein